MRILMAGGGTAGHINPAIAIADTLRRHWPEAEVLFIGASGKMETTLVPKAGYTLKTVEVSGFQRHMSVKNVGRNTMAVVRILTAGKAAGRIIKDFAPDIAIGTGGYVCGPVLRRAAKMGIPVIVHESNVLPGVTVKLLAKHAAAVLIADEEARQYITDAKRIEVTGNPVAGSFAAYDRTQARQELGIHDDHPLILSCGGSLGARRINETMTEVLKLSAAQGNFRHIHAAGKDGYTTMKQALDTAAVPLGTDIQLRPYIDDMPRCMAAADIVISRCGAMLLSELPIVGRAAILIPSPYVAENHQYYNAMARVKQGAAICIEERELTVDRLWQEIRALASDTARREQMESASRSLAVPDAAERVFAVIKEVVGR